MDTNATPPVENQTTNKATPDSQEQNRQLMGILCYLGILVLIPYFVAKDDAFVHFHIKQGAVLAGIEIATYFISMSMFFWGLWGVVILIQLGCAILSIVGIINVVQKKEAVLPIIGKWASKLSI